MARCGLIAELPPDAVHPRLSSGAFAVAKDLEKDRLIGDRRPLNATESIVADPDLPYLPRLGRWLLKPDGVLRAHSRDLRDFYYQLRVPDERLPRQAVGPRVPRSWLQQLARTDLDYVESVEPWHAPDLWLKIGDAPDDLSPDRWVQPAMRGVMMGDLNGVSAAQLAHLYQLQEHGLLWPAERLGSGASMCCRPGLVDVYIDDVGIVACVRREDALSRSGWDWRRAAQLDEFYRSMDVAQSVKKAVHGEVNSASLWGYEIQGLAGLVGIPWERRCGLLIASLLAAAVGVTGQGIQSLLGCLTAAFLPRRELLSVLGSTFVLAQRLPRRRHCTVNGPISDELVASAFLVVAAVVDGRRGGG